MSISSEIYRINNNIASAYAAIGGKGGTRPATENSANLASAINTIPQSVSQVQIYNASTQLFNSGSEQTIPAGYFVETYGMFGQRGAEYVDNVTGTTPNDSIGYAQRVFLLNKDTNTETMLVVVGYDPGNLWTTTASNGYKAFVIQYNYSTDTLSLLSNIRAFNFTRQSSNSPLAGLCNLGQLDDYHFVMFCGKDNSISEANGKYGGYVLITVSNDYTSVTSIKNESGNYPGVSTGGIPSYIFPLESNYYAFVHLRERKVAISVLQLNGTVFTEIDYADVVSFPEEGNADNGTAIHQSWFSACQNPVDKGIYITVNKEKEFMAQVEDPHGGGIYAGLISEAGRHTYKVKYDNLTTSVDMTVEPLYPLIPDKIIQGIQCYLPWVKSNYGDEIILGEPRWIDTITYTKEEGEMLYEYINGVLYVHCYNPSPTKQHYLCKKQLFNYYINDSKTTMYIPQTYRIENDGLVSKYFKIFDMKDADGKPQFAVVSLLGLDPTDPDSNFNMDIIKTSPLIDHPGSNTQLHRSYGYLCWNFNQRKVLHIEDGGMVCAPYWYNTTYPSGVVLEFGTDYAVAIGVTKTDCPITGNTPGTVYRIPQKF